jgi:hypothetical protein
MEKIDTPTTKVRQGDVPESGNIRQNNNHQTTSTLPNDFEKFIEEDFNKYDEEVTQQTMMYRIQQQPIKVIILLVLIYLVTVETFIAILQLPIWETIVLLYAGSFVADCTLGFCHLVMEHIPMEPVPASKRPLLQWLAFGFQYHHVDGNNWRRDDIFFLGLLRTGFFFFLPLALFQLVWVYSSLPFSTSRMSIFLWSLEFFCLFGQFAHAAAHGRWRHGIKGKIARWLQKAGIIIDPKSHHVHHTSFSKNFAIVTGHANPLLNFLYDYVFSRWVSKAMTAEAQREIYLDRKSELVRPFYAMFPAWRALHPFRSQQQQQQVR